MQPAPFFSLRLSVAAGWPLPSRTCAPPAPGHPRCSRAARTLLSVPSSELRPPDFSPAMARSPLRRCPAVGTGPRAQGPEPVFCSAYGHAGGDEPGQKPRAGTRRGVSWPPRKGAGRTVGRGRRGWRRTAAGPRARIRRGHLSRSGPARAAALRWAASGLHCCVPAPPAPRSSPREAVPCPLL